MFTVIDAVLIVIFLACSGVGIFKGFFSTISKPVRVIAAICITFVIASPIIDQWTGPYFEGLFYNDIYEYLVLNLSEVTSSEAISSLPLVLKIFAAISGIEISGGAEITTDQMITSLSEALAGAIGGVVSLVATYLGLYIIVSILLALVIAILNSMFSKGILGVVNKILGFALGGSVGVVICCIIASIVSGVSDNFVGGFVYEFFKDFSPLDFILSF